MIRIAQEYGSSPSSILGIGDTYTAFCFDEACLYLKDMLEQKNTPKWKDDTRNTENTEKGNLISFLKNWK